MRSDVEIPGLKVTIRAGVNRSRDIRLNVARQDNVLRGGGVPGRNHRNDRDGHVCGFRTQTGACVYALNNTGNENPAEQKESRNTDEPAPSPSMLRWLPDSLCFCLRLHKQHLEVFLYRASLGFKAGLSRLVV